MSPFASSSSSPSPSSRRHTSSSTSTGTRTSTSTSTRTPSSTCSSSRPAQPLPLLFRKTMMTTLFGFLLAIALLPAKALAGAPANVTSLTGTWSSGSGHVLTGLSFFNPGNNSFNYPLTAGQSYSFTDDGHWEQALFLYTASPSDPGCVTAQLIWQHGTFTRNSNNTLTLNPFEGDGHQQISSRCAQNSNVVMPYNQKEDMQGFEIYVEQVPATTGVATYVLKLYQFDGTPKPLMYQVYNPPQMLPTTQLHEKIIGELNAS